MPTFNAAFQQFPYEDGTDIQTSWLYDSGLVQVPVAAPAAGGSGRTPCELVRVHAPLSRKLVRFTMLRIGVKPEPPAVEADTTDQVLLKAVVNPLTPGRTVDGDPIYRIAGYYVYALLTPRVEEDGYPGPELGLTTETISDNVYTSFNPYLVG